MILVQLIITVLSGMKWWQWQVHDPPRLPKLGGFIIQLRRTSSVRALTACNIQSINGEDLKMRGGGGKALEVTCSRSLPPSFSWIAVWKGTCVKTRGQRGTDIDTHRICRRNRDDVCRDCRYKGKNVPCLHLRRCCHPFFYSGVEARAYAKARP
jgi:hypothetical protein